MGIDGRFRLRVIGLVTFGFLQILLHLSYSLIAIGWLRSLSRLRFKRIAAFAPCVEATKERPHIGPPAFEQRLRHTGAGMLVVSCAVRDNEPIAWNFYEVLDDVVGWHTDRAGDLYVGPLPRVGCS